MISLYISKRKNFSLKSSEWKTWKARLHMYMRMVSNERLSWNKSLDEVCKIQRKNTDRYDCQHQLFSNAWGKCRIREEEHLYGISWNVVKFSMRKCRRVPRNREIFLYGKHVRDIVCICMRTRVHSPRLSWRFFNWFVDGDGANACNAVCSLSPRRCRLFLLRIAQTDWTVLSKRDFVLRNSWNSRIQSTQFKK